MTLPYVCHKCRRILLRRVRTLNRSQWATKAAYNAFAASVAEIVPRQPKEASEHRQEPKGRVPFDEAEFEGTPIHYGREVRLDDLFAYKKRPTQPATRGRYSQHSDEPLEEEINGTDTELDGASLKQREGKSKRQHPSQDWKDGSHYVQRELDRVFEAFQSKKTSPFDLSSNNEHRTAQLAETPPWAKRRHALDYAEPVATQLDAVLRDDSKSISAAYRIFSEKYTDRNALPLRQPALQDRRLLLKGLIFGRLMKRVTAAWCEAPEDEQNSLPSPSQLSSQLSSLSVNRPELALDSIWTLLVTLLKQGVADAQEESSLFELEILKLWAHLFKNFIPDWLKARSTGTVSPEVDSAAQDSATPDRPHKTLGENLLSLGSPVSTSIDWSGLPNLEQFSFQAPGIPRSRAFLRKLRTCITMPRDHLSLLGVAALATFDHFTSRLSAYAADDINEDAAPFLKFIARTIHESHLDSSVVAFGHMARAAGLESTTIEDASNRMRDYAFQSDSSLVASSLGVKDTQPLSREALEAYFTSRLGRALEKANLRAVQRLWDHAVRAYTQVSDREKGAALSLAEREEDANPGALPSKLYSAFLYTLTGLGRHDSAVGVWNYMIEHGSEPTAHQYNAMMQGCGRRRDIDALNRIWQMMLNSGVKIDVSSWNTRVHAMALSGRSGQTLKVLEEMSDTWNREQEAKAKERSAQTPSKTSSVSLAIKPSIETLNACVTVFTRKGRRDLIQKAFAWGHAQGIRPDRITFNALVGLALRENNVSEALKLLAQMSKQGIEPDDATFSIILNTIVRSDHVRAMGPEEQSQAIVEFLDGMTVYGIGMGSRSNHVYTICVDRLLKDHRNIEAAKTVIDIMRKRKVIITPHIYTSLMTHYFESGDEPDFAAIENLWARIRNEGGAVDHLFFDRMIEMYARAGETGQALMFLGRMSNQGMKPSKSALMELLESLMRFGQWNRVQDVLMDIREGTGLVKGGMKIQSDFEKKFWAFIEEVENVVQSMHNNRRASQPVETTEESNAAAVTSS